MPTTPLGSWPHEFGEPGWARLELADVDGQLRVAITYGLTRTPTTVAVLLPAAERDRLRKLVVAAQAAVVTIPLLNDNRAEDRPQISQLLADANGSAIVGNDQVSVHARILLRHGRSVWVAEVFVHHAHTGNYSLCLPAHQWAEVVAALT